MKKVVWIQLAALLCTPWCLAMQMFDNPHFFRANHFFGEPRLEKRGLTSLDAMVSSGSTHTARNGNSDKVCLLSLYGPEKMLFLGSNVPGKNPNNPADLALINLGNLPARCGFAELAFGGSLNVLDVIFLATQNLDKGFFLQLHVPYRKIEINCINQCDLSPCDEICPNRDTQAWTIFLNQFDAILQQYGLFLGPVHKKGIGDVSVYVGWTKNYQDTQSLDYIDATVKIGVITPTSCRRNENIVFDIPLGYNGHIGVSANADLSIGAYEWLTVGGHFRGIVFASDSQFIRMKTDANQNGFIKLAVGKASISPGSIIEAGAFIKADHFVHGLSLLVGYSYDRKEADSLSACDTNLFPACVINSDTLLQQWIMHTMHYIIEYDFAKAHRMVCPRISFYFDQEVGGKRVFNTNMAGAGLGIDIAW